MTWNDVLTELSKPTWWISVVIAGIVINLLSAYLKSPLDTMLSSTSSWWRSKSEARRHAWEARVTLLRSSDEARQVVTFGEFRLRLAAIHLLLTAAFLMLCPSFVTNFVTPPPRVFFLAIFAMSMITFFLSFLTFMAAGREADALHEARRTAANPCEHVEGERR